jgi:hypothetical protein
LPGVFPQSFCEKALSPAILDELVHFWRRSEEAEEEGLDNALIIKDV